MADQKVTQLNEYTGIGFAPGSNYLYISVGGVDYKIDFANLKPSYAITFTNADLDGNSEIELTHSLPGGVQYPEVYIKDNNGHIRNDIVMDVTAPETVKLYLGGTISGTWYVRITKTV